MKKEMHLETPCQFIRFLTVADSQLQMTCSFYRVSSARSALNRSIMVKYVT